MRLASFIIATVVVIGLVIGCRQADEHKETRRPTTVRASSDPSSPTTTIALGMKMSVVSSRLTDFAGGMFCHIGEDIRSRTPGVKKVPDLYILPGNIVVYIISAGPVGASCGEYIVVRIMVGKVKIDSPDDDFIWLLSAKQEYMEYVREVTLSKEGLVGFVPDEGTTTRPASSLRTASRPAAQ